MATVMAYSNAPDLTPDDYLVVGLATCFLKQEGEVLEIHVVEPIPSAALEALMKGVPTSYQFACGMPIGTVLKDGEPVLPGEFPASAQLGERFAERAIAAARTYKRTPQSQTFIPVGTTYREFNYSVERKRVLNARRSVRKEDNVKQHEYTHKVL